MFIYKLFAWISCTMIVAGQFVFEPRNVILRNLVIDNNTGDVFVGGVNYIFKLNKNLTQLKNVSTPCIVISDCKSGETENANQLVMIENLTGTPRLFACGTYKYGACVTYDLNNFSHIVLEDTIGDVSNNQSYSSIALEDPSKNGILIASTILSDDHQTRFDYTLNVYGDRYQCTAWYGPARPCLGRSITMNLRSKGEVHYKINYILAVIVGKFRYFFSHNMIDGSNVARLCENYNAVSEIKTYKEMPLQCVGKDGTNYEQLVAAKVTRPAGTLAEKFGSTGDDDDAVLFGVFYNSIISQSAMCTYTFKQINEFFLKNIVECFGNNKLRLSKYYAKEKKCAVEDLSRACSLSSNNPKMTGTIKLESEALVTCSDCGLISSMDTTNYRGNVIAFLGSKDGKLSKFVLHSNSSARRYETSNRIPGSGILSVRFDRIGDGAYLLSPEKILKIPAEECGNRTSCGECVKGGDPYCGWCTLHATCTTYDKCPYYGSPLRYVRQSNECIRIVSLSPSSLLLSETAIQKINISIVNLPVNEKEGAYGCSVNDVKMPSTLNGDTMECSVPTSSQLPEASSDTGMVKAEVAVVSNETNAKIATYMLGFYQCSAISNCLKCTTGSLECSWCHYKAECTADASTTCPESFASWKSKASDHECPLLNTQTLYIPARVTQAVTVRGTHFPKPGSPDGQYQCTLNTSSDSYSIAATWNNSTSITCGAQEHKYSESRIEISANISVKLGKSDVKPGSGHIQVYLYDCHRTAELCGRCVGRAVAKVEYKCGWCDDKNYCSVSDGCLSESWVPPNGVCPGIPKIQSFHPKTGHVQGNSRLVIKGIDFGRSYKDVEKVSIAGFQCRTIKEDYVTAKEIVCLTSKSNKSLSAKIELRIANKTGLSEDEFHYQNPQVEDYEPKIGPVSGGTSLTIRGKELDTGVNIQVFLGQSKCINLRVNKTRITCTTSPFQNTTRKRRSISNDEKLIVTFDGLPPVYGPNVTSYKYVPDPVITVITPSITFPSSFQQINVTGSNLNGIHFPRIRLTFGNVTAESVCDKPSYDNMICPFPNLTKTLTRKVLADISFSLDDVTTWGVFSGYPKFKSMTIVPDPIIHKFDGVHVLKISTLDIKGNYLDEKDLLKYTITVGGKKCNISSIAATVIYCIAPDADSLPKQDTYVVLVNVSSSKLRFTVGELKYDIEDSTGSSIDMKLIYIIIGVAGAIFLIVVILMWCLYRRKKRQQEQNEKTYELQLTSLESKVAKECREAFAELQTDMTDFTTDLGDGSIHFFDFKNYAMRVLFPGVSSHSVMQEKMAQEDPKWYEALRIFSQLIDNKSFLLIFVRTLESQAQFKMQDRCNVASLLVIALQSKMDYCTVILQDLLAELIRKSMSKSHPKLLLRRTECIAEKLLTNWLTFTLSNFVKDKAGRPLFMLYKAIRFQIEKGPVDVITHEARYSLSEDKLLRQSIEYNKLTVTVEYEDNPPVQVDVLDTDTIEQAKEKIMEVLFKNIPFSNRIPKDELTLKLVVSPSNHTILKDEDVSSLREGEWKRLNTLGHYQVPDGTCLRLVKRFAAGFDSSEIHNASLPKVSYSPSLYSTSSLIQSSKQNISDADRKPWHLTKHVDSYVQEKDDPRHSKMLSEIYLTRLLSTKGTLQQYVDDMFDCIFPTFRKNERPPLPIKLLFDFLDDQAKELNITDPEVMHTWKNNSLPLRFWVNLIKNPNFLFDVNKAPIVDSCLSVIAQLFMDSCSVSEHILGKDSPSNKLLYAKEIPTYKQKVESFYKDVANAPRLTDEEIKYFFSAHYIEDFNVSSALKELYKYAANYQDELQEALEDARYPQLASKLEHLVAIFTDD